MRDDKFYSRVKDILIFKSTNGGYTQLKDYLNRNSGKHKNKVFYISDEKQQAQYIRLFKENDLEALYLDSVIDSHFINFLEMKETDTKFLSIDADISEALKDKEISTKEDKKLEKDLENLFKECLDKKDLKIKVEALKTSDIPAVILQSEQSKRMQEMSRYFGNSISDFPAEETLVLNRKNGLIAKLGELKENKDKKQDVDLICRHIYDLAVMNHKPLGPEQMAEFVKRSNKLLSRLAELES